GVEDVMKMQLDLKSLAAETFVPLLLKALDAVREELSELEKRAAKLLAGWDYVMAVDRPEPAIYAYWLKEFYEALWEDEYEAAGIDGFFMPLEVVERIIRGELAEPGRFERWTDAPLGELALSSLRSALSKLTEDAGSDDPIEWRWGDVHVYAFDHPLGEALPWLNYPRYPAPGGFYTVNVAPGLEVKNGPSIRYVADLSPGGTGYLALPGGNSGHPLSRHYLDQLEMWVNGGYKPLVMPSTPEGLEGGRVLILAPRGG
ncbi:MAG TPA: hypothetical protein EYP90_12315, partial [Chromatiaceae bacterium]|nr:hypothetical protein [Chromatiaceae bacterium]